MRLRWLAQVLGAGLALYLRLVARTCRLSGTVTRDRVVLAFWHEYNMAAFVAARKARGDLPHASFSTRGFRGTVISTLLARSGTPLRVFELPPEEDRAAGRAFALRMATLAGEGYSLIVTPDGPFGPRRVAKPGALIVARASGLPLQPWAVTMRPAIRLWGRWDRQLLPLPFCRLRVVEGERLGIGPRQPVRALVAAVEAELNRLDA
jgi:lysophospholipid acyltransferase (LPLAT)-like uncharacterized protein